ncbi:hypothetical protein SD457_12645 [Coprobacillaceae bacterium CR2/5/TPMF4]|nr:hypothetical protein SD457_12645 [Coprobacillaceae bacterium CR2/5/TPMF4]
MVAGAAIFLLERGEYELVNFTNIRNIITSAKKKVLPEEDSYSGGSINKQTELLKLYLERYRDKNDDSAKLLDGYMKSEDNTESSFFSTFTNKMNLVTQNKAIEKILASNEIDLKSIGEKRVQFS